MAEEKKEHKKKKAHAGHGFKSSHIEHHADGSHTVHHMHEDGAHADVKHAAANLDAVHDSMQDNMGQSSPEEDAANAGQHGIPDEQAQAAGIPTGAPAAGAGPVGA